MSRPGTGFPDGLEQDHLRGVGHWQKHASPLALLILAAIVLGGMSGALGHETSWAAGPVA